MAAGPFINQNYLEFHYVENVVINFPVVRYFPLITCSRGVSRRGRRRHNGLCIYYKKKTRVWDADVGEIKIYTRRRAAMRKNSKDIFPTFIIRTERNFPRAVIFHLRFI